MMLADFLKYNYTFIYLLSITNIIITIIIITIIIITIWHTMYMFIMYTPPFISLPNMCTCMLYKH